MERKETTVSLTAAPRAQQLQFLRFLAFFNVYIAHAEVWLFFAYPSANCSTAAVSFFFILGGLVTGYSAYGKEIRLTIVEYGRSVWKKVKKIYPLYFITMLIPVIYSNVPEELAAGHFDGQVLQLLKNLLMIQSWFPEGSMSFNGVGWYISTMMFLSLFSLPMVYLISRLYRCRKGLILLIGMFGGVLFLTAVYCYLTKTRDAGYWHYVFPPARLGEHLSGIIFGYIAASIQGKWKDFPWKKVLFTLAEAGVLVYWFRSLYSSGGYWRSHIVNWVIPNYLLLVVFTPGLGWISHLFRNKWLVRLGDISFECFLIHNLLVIGFVLTNPTLSQTLPGKVMAFSFCLVFTVILSLYLSKPAQKK